MKYGFAILAAAAMAVAAEAAPITTPPPVITALGGNVTAVYVFADAWDTSSLGLAAPSPAVPQIFCNHVLGSCGTANSAGDVMSLGNRNGMLTFTLSNLTTGLAYDSVSADGGGAYHAMITTDYSDFGVGALPAGAAAVLAGLSNVTFVGWEDLDATNGSDFDYNDLIFAFSNTAPNENPGVPEPLTLALMGAGLVGAFGLRRIKKS
jgi:hypothetical protein